MISEELTKEFYGTLTAEQKLKLALYSDFDENAKDIYDWLTFKKNMSIFLDNPSQTEIIFKDGVYYIYEDGTAELFDYEAQNKPIKKVKRIGVVMGQHSLAVNLEDYNEQPLTCNKDTTDYAGYITEYDDAVADWNGKTNTEHIKQIGTNIPLKDDEWLPSVAELYLIYLNKRSINSAITLAGGSRIKDGWYWSSTEYSATDAWNLYLIDGTLGNWYAKVSNSSYVRAVAAFH